MCQFGGSLDQERNLAVASALIREAADGNANIVLLPELANTIYLPFASSTDLFSQAESIEENSVTSIRRLAKETGTVIVYPFFERDGDEYFNSTVTADPDGSIINRYRKAAIPTQGLYSGHTEHFYFSKGDIPPAVVETPWGIRIGVVICYERNLPEPARVLGLQQVDLILVPVATTHTVRPWWELLLRAHAVFNQSYVAACNKVGMEAGGSPDTSYFGESLGVDPRGTVVAHGSPTDQEIVHFQVSAGKLDAQRERWTFLQDRRPEHYSSLAQPLS